MEGSAVTPRIRRSPCCTGEYSFAGRDSGPSTHRGIGRKAIVPKEMSLVMKTDALIGRLVLSAFLLVAVVPHKIPASEMHCQPDAEMNALNGLPLSPSMSVMPVSPPSDFLAQHDKEIADPEPLKQYIADKFQVDDENADKVVKTAYKVSGDTGVAPNLLLAIAAVESSFDPHAEGRGSKGLMQIQVSAHREEIRQIGGIRGLYDIVKNFTLGGKIFKNCIAQVNGNVHKALLCYNGATVANSYPDKVLKIKAKFDAVEKSGNIED
jgi:hypothetical protein